MILNFNKKKLPRRTICQKCNTELIPGKDALDQGLNIVTCPACVFKDLMKVGMIPQQMVSVDIVYNEERGYGVGINFNVLGLPTDMQTVLPEEAVRDYIRQIDEHRSKMKGGGKV